jgi:HEAT repeat protein
MRWNSVAAGFAVALLGGASSLSRADEPDSAALDERMLKDARIATDGPSLLEFFRQRTVSNTDIERIQRLVTDLGDDSFEVRQNASAQLVAVGPRATRFLKDAEKSKDIEVVRRAQDCLKRIEAGNTTALVAAAARLLAVRKPTGTAEVLLAYVPAVEDDLVGDAVNAALTAVAVRDGKADPALVGALTDKSTLRRAAAGSALCRAKADDQKPAIRKLLEDKDPLVRLHVGLALAEAKEKDAVPVLIALLDDLRPDQTGILEDALYLIAGEKAPAVSPGSNPASRRAYREAWAAWWREHGAGADLARLTQPSQVLGYTLVVLLDEGKIQELDRAKRVRWKIEELGFPLDVQYLPGDRVLIAEQGANRVTERDHKGKILWDRQVLEPLMAQRLPNGATLIATRQQVIEINRDGKTLTTHTRPNGEFVMRAQKLRNGDLAMISMDINTNIPRYVRLNAKGEEAASFNVQVKTSGGRIDVLPDGHVLVPEMEANRVAEYDAAGKVVWSAQVQQPIAALRLANGHTLVTSMTQNRAVELDRAGKQVWEFRHESRVSRAYRR